jgi:hypothetical protein
MPSDDDLPDADILGEPIEVEQAFVTAALAGNHLTTLRALRDLLALDIARASARGLMAEVSSLTGRLSTVLDRIAELAPDTGKGTALDEVTKRREKREATGSSGTAQRRQRR